MDFDQSLGESGTLLIFKVTGSNFYPVTSLWTLKKGVLYSNNYSG